MIQLREVYLVNVLIRASLLCLLRCTKISYSVQRDLKAEAEQNLTANISLPLNDFPHKQTALCHNGNAAVV
jgi:hypothetical protein